MQSPPRVKISFCRSLMEVSDSTGRRHSSSMGMCRVSRHNSHPTINTVVLPNKEVLVVPAVLSGKLGNRGGSSLEGKEVLMPASLHLGTTLMSPSL